MQPYDTSIAGEGTDAQRRRPLGVTFVAVLTVLTAVIYVPRLLQFVGEPLDWILVLGWIPIVQVLGILLTGIGLWSRQNWARKWAIAIYMFLMLPHLLELPRSPIGGVSIVSALLYGAIIIYLLWPGTRDRFETD